MLYLEPESTCLMDFGEAAYIHAADSSAQFSITQWLWESSCCISINAVLVYPGAHGSATCSVRCGSKALCAEGTSAGTENPSRILSIKSSISFCHFNVLFFVLRLNWERQGGRWVSPKRGSLLHLCVMGLWMIQLTQLQQVSSIPSFVSGI